MKNTVRSHPSMQDTVSLSTTVGSQNTKQNKMDQIASSVLAKYQRFCTVKRTILGTQFYYLFGMALSGVILSQTSVAIANSKPREVEFEAFPASLRMSSLGTSLPVQDPNPPEPISAIESISQSSVDSLGPELVVSDYIFGVGDQISIQVFGYDEFTGSWVVLPDGSIILPVLGAIAVAGETPQSLTALLSQQLNNHLVEPVVTVRPMVLRPIVVTVSGEVHRPGPFQFRSPSENAAPDAVPTISAALIEAGGITQNADIQQIVLSRSQHRREPVLMTLNLWDSLWSNTIPQDLLLLDGDVIFVPELPENTTVARNLLARSNLSPRTIPVRVIGEIEGPGEVEVSPDTSLSGAIAVAGGPTEDARLKRVQLIRLNSSGQVETQTIDLRDLDDDYQVQSGDIIFVPERGVSTALSWTERFLSIFTGISVIDRILN